MTYSSAVRRANPHQQWPVTVAAVCRPAARVARVTLAADHLRTMTRAGADEYFGLVLPGPDSADPLSGQVVRWYTYRAHRPDAGEVDVDMVLHGDEGPGSAWAARTQPGDRLAIKAGRSIYTPPAGEPQVLLADETSAPALAAIGDWLRAGDYPTDRITAYLEAPDRDCLVEEAWPFPVTVLGREGHPGEAVLRKLRELPLTGAESAWACGESRLATQARRYLLGPANLDRRKVAFSGYWKVGQAKT